MYKIENDIWSDSRPYYILYQDKFFLKNIYAQIFSEFPDIGQIAYIGATTKKIAKDYSINKEQATSDDKRKSYEEYKLDKTIKNDDKNRVSIAIIDSNEESQIREYANIQEIKEMNNMLFYKQMLRKLTCACIDNLCDNLCHICGKIDIYDNYKEDEDIFVNMQDSCIWLKKENLDTSVKNISNIFGKVHLVGYILEEKTKNSPRIIKAIAIYT